MADVVAYVDGFNLYHGLKAKYGHAYLWLDLYQLVSLTRSDDTVVAVKYFTAIVKGEPDAALRQETYLSALTAYRPQVRVIRGRFKKKTMRCRDCTARWRCAGDPPKEYRTYEEKLTDVALAAEMVADAALGVGSMSLLISADSDFRPAIEASLRLRPDRPVLIGCPPGRVGPRHDFASRVPLFPLREEHLRASLLPDLVAGPARAYLRPAKWA